MGLLSTIRHFTASKPADNYTIVEIIEGAETHLYSLPSKWVHRNGWNRDGKSDESAQSEKDTDLCYWPRNAAGYRLLERGKEDPSIEVNRDCLIEYRCKIAKSGFTTFEEVYRIIMAMIYCEPDVFESKGLLFIPGIP